MSVFPTLAASNYEASVKFYTEQLGFASDMNMPMPDGSMFGIFTFNGRSTSLSISDDKTQYERGKGVVLMLYPEGDFDIDAYYAQIQERGVKIETEIKTEFWGDRTFSIKDPDGYYLTIAKTLEMLSPEQAMERAAQNGV